MELGIDWIDRHHRAMVDTMNEIGLLSHHYDLGDADALLERQGFGRAHHRVLYFVNLKPGMPVADILDILKITKQSLARVLSELVARGYVAQEPGSADRRHRLLTLTPEGMVLERRLFERQRDRLSAAYRDAGAASVDGFRRVMRAIMDDAARGYLDRAEASGRTARPR